MIFWRERLFLPPMERNVIELLAPAKNLECGRVAIDHGADAVYVGSPRFGARKAAANSVEDIAALADYAHLFGARVHVALNTILSDAEVAEARRLAWALHGAGADVLIVQDAALLRGSMPPMELHASTQCDNRTAAKVRFWQDVGLRQVVLARELSVDEIADIARQTTVRLEAFVHGALCVSYSGRCYMSLACGGRSANRGECAQPCRLEYDLTAADGSRLCRRAHLLSLRDNNQSANLERLIDAGVSSFKIEGRLKDADYVANVTLHYRQLLDAILGRRPGLRRLSSGAVSPGFAPDPAKSFNRGFTGYFADGRTPDIWQPRTSKSVGEPLGEVVSVGRGGVFVKTRADVSNGDGLCLFTPRGLVGFKVDTARRRADGLVVVDAQNAPRLTTGDVIFRNHDAAFADALRHDKTMRKIALSMRLDWADGVLSLRLADSDGVETVAERDVETDAARSPEASCSMLVAALSKTGGTPFAAGRVEVSDAAAGRFVSAAVANALRREAFAAHAAARVAHFRPADVPREEVPDAKFPEANIGAEGNVVNSEARAFFESHGARVAEWGHERCGVGRGARLMTMRHCLLFSLGKCLRRHPECAALLPLTLTSSDGKRFEARPDCQNCQMEIRAL